MSDTPIFDTLRTRKSATPTPTLLDASTPAPSPIEVGPTPVEPAPRMPLAQPEPLGARTELSVGSFFAEQRALIDSRRMDLVRVGMLPDHVTALKMPDLVEMPRAPAVDFHKMPPRNEAESKKKLAENAEGEVF